jgi:hypothetical protein
MGARRRQNGPVRTEWWGEPESGEENRNGAREGDSVGQPFIRGPPGSHNSWRQQGHGPARLRNVKM